MLDELPQALLGDFVVSRFSASELIKSHAKTVILRGHLDGQPDDLVVCKGSIVSSSDENRKTLQEYELLKLVHDHFNSNKRNLFPHHRVIKPLDLIWSHGSYSLILEDFRGTSLRDYIAVQILRGGGETGLSLEQFLDVGIQLAEALHVIHSARIIHMDINPDNILVRETSSNELEVQVIDFNIARVSEHTNHSDSHEPVELEGSLPYLSPEQTGRTELIPDQRSDIYSVGITLWELLVGHPPFTCRDASEYIFCHLAREIEPIKYLKKDIPPILSDIVAKLVEKAPMDRYQSALGLREDLKACKQEIQDYKATHGIDPAVRLSDNDTKNILSSLTFKIARSDFFPSIVIPRGKLYGKQNQDQIVKYFEALVAGSTDKADGRLFIIEGPHGSGKNVIIEKAKLEVIKKGGRFAQGDYSGPAQASLFSGLIGAASNYLKNYLSESEEDLQILKEKLGRCLNLNDITLLQERIAEMKILFSEHRDEPTKVEDEQDDGTKIAEPLQKLISGLSSSKQTIAFFLDNVHLAESDSFAMMEWMLQNVVNLMIVATTLPLKDYPWQKELLQSLKRANVTKLILTPFTSADISEILRDSIFPTQEDHNALAKLLFTKTGGNPFHVFEILKYCEKEGLIRINDEQTGWVWNLNLIDENIGFSNVVVDNIVAKISRESKSVVDILQDAASLKFSHEKIRKVFYEMVPYEQRSSLHLKVCRLLSKKCNVERILELDGISDVVRHFNQNLDSLEDKEELELFARANYAKALNFLSSSQASALAHMEVALSYLEKLSDNPWRDFYDLERDICLARLRIKGNETNNIDPENDFDSVFANVVGIHDKAAFVNLISAWYMKQGEISKTVDTIFPLLKEMGLVLPSTDADLEEFAKSELTKLEAMIDNRTATELIAAAKDRSLSDDSQCLQTLLSNLMLAAHRSMKIWLFLSISLLGCTKALSSGFGAKGIEFFCMAPIAYLGVLRPVDFKRISFFSKVVDQLRDHCCAESLCKTVLLRAISCQPFMVAHQDIIFQVEEMIASAKSHKQTSLRYFATTMLLDLSVQWGLPPSWYQEFIAQNTDFYKQCNGDKYAFRNILDAMEAGSRGEVLSNQNFSPAFKTVMACLNIRSAFVFEREEQTAMFESVLQNLDSLRISVKVVEFLFFAILIGASMHDSSIDTDVSSDLLKKTEHLLELLTSFTSVEPYPYLFKLHLAEAEVYRIKKDVGSAVMRYESAISLAHKHGFRMYEAIATELFGRFWTNRGSVKLANACITEAYTLWKAWGSDIKCSVIDTKYPELKLSRRPMFTSWTSATISKVHKQPNFSLSAPKGGTKDLQQSTTNGNTVDLDTATLLKFSESLREETTLDGLLRKSLLYILSNVGATKSLLALDQKGRLIVQGLAQLKPDGSEQVDLYQDKFTPISSMKDSLPIGIANFVFRTKEIVLLSNPKASPTYGLDPYILKECPKSILCCPIVHHNNVTGLIYLENKYQEGSFTRDRFTLIQSLMPTVFMSIENAKLIKANHELEIALKEGNKKDPLGPKYQIDAPIRKVIDTLLSLKSRCSSDDDPDAKQIDSILTLLISSDLFSSSIDEINDENGRGIDLDTKSWIETSLLQKTSKAKSRGDHNKDKFSHLQRVGSTITEGTSSGSSSGFLTEAARNSLETRFGESLINAALSTSHLNEVYVTLEDIMSPDFDVFRLAEASGGRPLYFVCRHLLEKYGLNSNFNIEDEVSRSFFLSVEAGYHNQPYHNSSHAADVLQTLNMLLLSDPLIARNFTKLEILGALIASAVHDIDHPGVNNNFLVQSAHPLAIFYNDLSVLEYHHASKAFDICRKKETDIFASFNQEDKKAIRKLIISMVVATDMAQHFNYINKLKGKVSTSRLNFQDAADRHLVLEMAIKCADLNNPTKNLEASKAWACKVLEEFFNQGDRERQMGITVSTFMDRKETNIPKCQIGFIDILVSPLFACWSECVPSEYAKRCLENLVKNRAYWESLLDRPEEIPKIPKSEFRPIDFGDNFKDFSGLSLLGSKVKSFGPIKGSMPSSAGKDMPSPLGFGMRKNPITSSNSTSNSNAQRTAINRRHSNIENAIAKFTVPGLAKKGRGKETDSVGHSKASINSTTIDEKNEGTSSSSSHQNQQHPGHWKSDMIFKRAKAGFTFGKVRDSELPTLPKKPSDISKS
ncbi:hypothetical protein HDU97_007405 [Phlyctochytrium planicorne]|nr:hypothetical protein HDU97_007405 [Phlyctochytrium planicorne]